jgi:hypothetical protein
VTESPTMGRMRSEAVAVTCAEVRYLAAYLREAAEDGAEVDPEKLARAAEALEAGLADTARVERVRAALDASEPLTIDGCMVRDVIRAALDGPQEPVAKDNSPKPSVRDIRFMIGGTDCG